MPEYDYTREEEVDPLAEWQDTSKRKRRDHFFLLGNRRLNLVAYNRGYTEFYIQDRGLENWTSYDPDTHNYGGGFSLVHLDPGEEGERIIPFLSSFAPVPLKRLRRFGTSYLYREECEGVLKLSRILWVPEGDHPYLLSEVRIVNLDEHPHRLWHFEVWDVNRISMEPHLLRSGTLLPEIPEASLRLRRKLNEPYFIQGIHARSEARLRFQVREGVVLPPPWHYAYGNAYPYEPFLHSFQPEGEQFFTDGRAGWDLKGFRWERLNPEPLPPVPALNQPGILLAGRFLSLEPGEEVVLRYAFGVTLPGAPAPLSSPFFSEPLSFPSREFFRDGEERARALVRWEAGPELYPEEEPYREELKRELAWHSAFLQNAGGWQEYFEHYLVNQGSAYLYLHGADGAVRDFVFTLVPLIYIAPDLAREILLYAARMRKREDGGFAYAVGGYGYLSSAVIHFLPSDLDLFYFWGVAEYLAATGDVSLLAALEPLWPREESPRYPLLYHLRLGYEHLLGRIGIGDHGLIKLGSGDWDDSITFFAPDRSRAILYGESIANSALAAFALPWLGAALGEWDAGLSRELLALGELQKEAVAQQWNGGWYRRAYFDPEHPFGDEVIFLFPNALAMIAGIPGEEQAETLLKHLERHLANPSLTGLIQFLYLRLPEGILEGATDQGSTNPAIAALGVWGASRYAPQKAWEWFLRNTMTRKAEAFPGIWHGIWSGPDAYYSASFRSDAGETWASPVTPMKDFPVFNSNYHLGPLLGILRMGGIEPVTVATPQGVRLFLGVCPRFPQKRVTLEFPLFTLELKEGGYSFRYRPQGNSWLRLAFCAPPGTRVLYRQTPLPVLQGYALWEGEVRKGEPLSFQGDWE